MAVWQFWALMPSVACKGMENVRSLELADIVLGAATIIVMLALPVVSMPGCDGAFATPF
jgi:hypothetical protein